MPTLFKRNLLHVGGHRQRLEQTFSHAQSSNRRACFLSALASSHEAGIFMSARCSLLPLFYPRTDTGTANFELLMLGSRARPMPAAHKDNCMCQTELNCVSPLSVRGRHFYCHICPGTQKSITAQFLVKYS